MADAISVLLDQNHWIYLSRAYWGRPHRPAHGDVAKRILDQVIHRYVRMPLNVIHLIEHLRNTAADRRARLAEVFETFSRGWFLSPWEEVIPDELRNAVSQTFLPNAPVKSPEVIGRGYLWSRGRELLPTHWTDREVELFKCLSAAPGQLYNLLTFPNDEGHARLREGIAASNDANRKAAEDLRSVWRPYPKEILRRAQYARYMLDKEHQLVALLAAYGLSIEDFLALGSDRLINFWQRVPSLDVDCELTLYRDRQWSRKVERNDVFDIGHLALGIPYCDAIVVEHFWARAIEETGLATKYNVSVFTDIADLGTWMESLPAP